MSLRHALLGLLAEGPMSGYDLTRRFKGPGNVWTAKHSQIYPELARLMEAGLIRPAGEGPRGRKSYAITDAGLSEVRRWLTETEPDRTVRDESFLRVFFLWLLDPAQAREYVRGEAEFHRAKLNQYEASASGWRPATAPERSNRIALEAGILHERALVQWAEWAERQLARGKT